MIRKTNLIPAEDIEKGRELFSRAMTLREEISDLNDELKDTIKALAAKLLVKPAQVRKLMREAQRWREWEEQNAQLAFLRDVLLPEDDADNVDDPLS